MNIDLIAQMKTSMEFFEAYHDGDEKRLYQGKGLIFYALSNTNMNARYEISNFLLDKGADVTGITPNGSTALHVLLGHVKHDAKATVELCKRLIDCGADVGVLDKDNISIMQNIVNIGIHENELESLYDMLFAQPNLDFTSKNFRGFSPMDLAIKRGTRPKLIERMREYNPSGGHR